MIIKLKKNFAGSHKVSILLILILTFCTLGSTNLSANPKNKLLSKNMQYQEALVKMNEPALSNNLRLGINFLSHDNKGFGGLGLHSNKFDVIIYANSYSDDNETNYKESFTTILLESHLKTGIGAKSWFTYGIGFERKLGYIKPEVTTSSSTFPQQSLRIEKYSKMFIAVGFESQIAEKLLLNFRYEVLSSKAVDLENNVSYNQIGIGNNTQLSIVFTI